MSYNLVDPVTGELTRVAGSIDTSIIPSDASASNKLATTNSTLKIIQLSGSVDCNTLTESGLYIARDGAVSALTNIPVELDSSVQISGGFSILVTASSTEGTFFGSQMFIPYGSDLPFIRKAYYFNGQYWTDWQELATESDLNSKGVFKGYIEPNKKLTINMNPYSEVYGYVQVKGSASVPFRLHNAAYNATPTVFLKRSVTINEENVYVDKPFGTTVSIGSLTIAYTNGVWTITNTSTETESYWVGGGANSVTLSDV